MSSWFKEKLNEATESEREKLLFLSDSGVSESLTYFVVTGKSPPVFTVLENEFKTFEEVVGWAWNEHKIDFWDADGLPLHEKHEACRELERMVRWS